LTPTWRAKSTSSIGIARARYSTDNGPMTIAAAVVELVLILFPIPILAWLNDRCDEKRR